MQPDDRRPTTDDRRPTTDDRRPTTDDRRPTTDDPDLLRESDLQEGGTNTKSPEVVLISFVSASSSRSTLTDLLSLLPCGLQRAI
jgi:hypothetical protein